MMLDVLFINPSPGNIDLDKAIAGFRRCRIPSIQPHAQFWDDAAGHVIVSALRTAADRGWAHIQGRGGDYGAQLKAAQLLACCDGIYGDDCESVYARGGDASVNLYLSACAGILPRRGVIQASSLNPRSIGLLSGAPASDQGATPIRDFVRQRLEFLRCLRTVFPLGVWPRREDVSWVQLDGLSLVDLGWLLAEVTASGLPMTAQISLATLASDWAGLDMIGDWRKGRK